MKISLEDVINGALAILLASLLRSYLPNPITDTEVLAILNNSLMQIILISVVTFYSLNRVLSLVSKILRSENRSPSPKTVSPRRKPKRVDSTWRAEKFGVVWEVIYGTRIPTGEPYAYAKDPRCPNCDAELMTDKKKRYIFGDKAVWVCPSCRFSQKRPNKFLYNEKDAVERTIERDARQEYRNN